MSYTDDLEGYIAKANAARIVACVNGCAGLNPVAYWACVEVVADLVDLSESYDLTSEKEKNALVQRIHEVGAKAREVLVLAEQH